MTSLFEPAQAGDIALANRIVMAPLTRNRSPGAIPNNLNATYYEQRATAGLIVTEGTPSSQQGQGYADVPGLYKQEAIEGWKKITDGVHSAGGKIVAQIWHVGRISHTSLQPHGGQPVAPSAIPAKSKTYIINDDGTGAFAETSEPRALTIDDIGLILEDYRSGARAALEAGFDGVEIHAANGYLIEQFLKSSTNQRTDDYGGSIENRARFLLEVVDAVAEEIGAGRIRSRFIITWWKNSANAISPSSMWSKAQRADRVISNRATSRSITRPSRAPIAMQAARACGLPIMVTTARAPSKPWKAAKSMPSPSARPSSPIRIWCVASKTTRP